AVVPYLLRRNLISAQTIVEGDLVVVEASQHNLNFQVITKRGPCYLLKQGGGTDGIETVAREATVYQRLQSPTEGREFDRYLPRFVGYDQKEQILIIEFIRDAHNLREYHDRWGRFPLTKAAALGTGLGILHGLTVVGSSRKKAAD